MQQLSLKLTVFSLTTLLMLVFVSLPLVTSAQFGGGNQDQGTVTLRQNPKHPEPNESVSFNLESYSVNLNTATITWVVDGAVQSQGIAQTNFSYDAGSAGSQTNVTAQINLQDGVITKETTLTPGTVDMVWQSNGYTPPFYKGKTLYAPYVPLTVVALPTVYTPNGTRYDKNDLVYTWSYNKRVFGSESGYGRTSFTVNAPPGENQITVEVENRNGTTLAKKTISVHSETPRILFYEEDPLLGIQYNQAIESSMTLTEKETTVVAEPYFFTATAANDSELSYRWEMNGNQFTPGGQKNTATFRTQEEQIGRAQIALEIEHRGNIFHSAINRFSVAFDGE